ncbi:putative capsid protein [Combu double-strand RNA mycovirus]|uniref:Putative capsid protein n=1 Tax=Combu double-strand RNA mycovirus TaxID=2507518 RepID=A0A410HYN1_9VIRU|nr:putative capsid protein [Combu double-strand RNA mycovirus]
MSAPIEESSADFRASDGSQGARLNTAVNVESSDVTDTQEAIALSVPGPTNPPVTPLQMSPQLEAPGTPRPDRPLTPRVPRERLGSFLTAIQGFLYAKGVRSGWPTDGRQLFPADWRIGKTTLHPDKYEVGYSAIISVLPEMICTMDSGRELRWFEVADQWTSVNRMVAKWQSAINIVAAMLTCARGVETSELQVRSLAQQSPEALEKLKEAGAQFKAHFQRFLDPVAFRRSPEFNRVALRYKAELRGLIDEQQKAVRALRAATRRVNQVLGERDAELARLDSGYTPKRVTATAALARFGIDLDADQTPSIAGEDTVNADVLDGLDF